MPSKKPTKARSGSRGRSRSVGRTTGNRSRTPTRSRSRSKVIVKRIRTPASESKVRRRSPSSSSSSSERATSRQTMLRNIKSIPKPSETEHSKTNIREPVPTRCSQRLVQKVDTTRNVTEERFSSNSYNASTGTCSLCHKLGNFFRQKICPSPIVAFFCLVSLFPLTLWLNLLVSTDARASKAAKEPTYLLAGVSWPLDWQSYLDYRCHLFVLAYLLVHCLIARLIPIGYRMDQLVSARRLDYRQNGFISLIFFCGLYAFAQWCSWASNWIPKPSVLLPKYRFSLLTASGNIALLAALLVYSLTRRVPRPCASREGNTGNFFVDFWVGRSTRPDWFGLDWKILGLRPGSVALLLMNVTYLLEQWQQFGRVSPPLVALVCMQSMWIVDLFAFEYTLAYTFETRHEGFGYYAIAGYLLFPFIYSIGATYLSSRPYLGRLYRADAALDVKNCGLLGLSIVLFLLGYWIYRASNNQKDLFRRQPNHPSFGTLDKISGPHAQRLLAGGWWGFVRHPNYLGDLMMAYAQALPAGFTSILPWFYPLFLTCFMLHRIWRTEHLSSEKYGVVMIMYKKLVPNKLIPRIF